jgi:hypothetical protein
LSQLSEVGKPSVGIPDRNNKLLWADFVQLVLELTIQAYQAMLIDGIAQQNWEENVFTVRLGDDYIRNIVFDRELPIRHEIRTKLHTDAMRAGKQSTIQAKEIDLKLFDVWERDSHKRHFVWEAKRVGDKKVNNAYENLNSEYVNEAIYRFIKREYADGLNDAGVLGYVLGGSVTNIVADINQAMGKIRINPPLPPSNHLVSAQPIEGFSDIYDSHHSRIDNTNIQLHHLFFTFDFH